MTSVGELPESKVFLRALGISGVLHLALVVGAAAIPERVKPVPRQAPEPIVVTLASNSPAKAAPAAIPRKARSVSRREAASVLPAPEAVPQGDSHADVPRPAEAHHEATGISGTRTTQGSETPSSSSGTGDGERKGEISPHFLAQIRTHLSNHRVYPYAARRLGLEGTVLLRFSITPEGRAANIASVGGATSDVLRQAAIVAAQAATPFPIPPGGAELTVEVPLTFVLED